MAKQIVGIQQIGIGVSDVHEAWTWYRKNLSMDIPVFEEAAEANLMLPYTDGSPQKRHAILAINLQGGGGFEIWQYTSRTPVGADFEIQMGDLGILFPKIKCRNVAELHQNLLRKGVKLISNVVSDPAGNLCFGLKDLYGNIFQIVESDDWYSNTGALTGGVAGAVIGVSDIDKALKLYRDVLGYDKVIYDQEGTFPDLTGLPSGDKRFRRVLLGHSEKRKGAFSKLLGKSEIELIMALDRKPSKIFENRLWGDLGYIHLCFDVIDMQALKAECEASGFPFTVDSSQSFDMGEAAGHFTYVEDPDGTLIEFVETHKIPILKKIGWYLNLKKRNPLKPLPRLFLAALALNRKKD
ncbi:MAG: VOC family protein [Flavobacteriales bacterium]|nr:VOC family protein [Flavobacteriales bacterium]